MKEKLQKIIYIILAISIILNIKYYLHCKKERENYIGYTYSTVEHLEICTRGIQDEIENGDYQKVGSVGYYALNEFGKEAGEGDLYMSIMGIYEPKLTYQERERKHYSSLRFSTIYDDISTKALFSGQDRETTIELCKKYEKALYNYGQKLSKDEVLEDNSIIRVPNYDLSMSELKQYWKEFYLEAGEVYIWSNPQYWRR